MATIARAPISTAPVAYTPAASSHPPRRLESNTANRRPADRHSAQHPDEERLARLARTDRSAFSELYERYSGRVYGYLLSRTSSPTDAEELTSRVFLNAFANLDQYRARGKGFSAWLMSIAHNLLANWYRDRGRRPPIAQLDEALDVPSELPAPESRLVANELSARVQAAVEALAADRQELIALKYVDGLSNAQIGRIMGRSEGAVKSLHHRTLRQLHGVLADID